MTVDSCTGEMKRVHDCKLMYWRDEMGTFFSVHESTFMYPFHFFSTRVYSHVPVSFLQYMTLQSCTRFISPVHDFTLMYPFHFFTVISCTEELKRYMTVNSCTGEMKQVHDCKLMYRGDWMGTWPSTWLYTHVPVSFLQYTSLQSCIRFISSVHEFTVMYPFHFFSTWIYSHVPVNERDTWM
jgi:hypothetical protein